MKSVVAVVVFLAGLSVTLGIAYAQEPWWRQPVAHVAQNDAKTRGPASAQDVVITPSPVAVDMKVPLWSILAFGVSGVGAWAVAMYRINVFAKYHKEHYIHAEDDERHWTKRERDALDKTLNEISGDIKSLLQRHSQ